MFSTRMSTLGFSMLLLLSLMILTANFLMPLTPDEAYYWVWSKHLSWSYFEGPPLTAYLIYGFTELLGNSAFVVRLPSVLCFGVAAYALYRLALKLFDQKVARTALIIFSFLPFVQVLVHATTPDSPLILFWTLTLYSFYLAVHENNTACFYLSGICAGLLLLSKYMGVLLPASFFLYLLFNPAQRKTFLNPHLYAAGVLALLIFSPVIWWNYQHDWMGFAFQWHHGVAEQKVFRWWFLGLFIGGQLVVFSPVFFVTLIIILYRKTRVMWADARLLYLWWSTVIPLLFFMYNGLFAKSQANWAIVSYIAGTLILAYWVVYEPYRKAYQYGTVLNLAIVVLLMLLACIPYSPLNKKFHVYPAMLAQAAAFMQDGDFIFADKNTLAAQLMFYSPSHQIIYVPESRRDAFWNLPMPERQLQHAWLITYENAASTLSYGVWHCLKKTDLSDPHALTANKLSLYECRL